MDTLVISKKIEHSGVNREQEEVIAQSIVTTVKEHQDKLATKRDLYFLGAVIIAGFGYIISTQNTIISAITNISS
jgi:hypothetical protein